MKQKSWRNIAYWLSPRLIFSDCSYTAQVHLLRDGTTHNRWEHVLSISNQEKAPQVCPQDNLIEATLHLRVPFPRCVKLTTKVNQDQRPKAHGLSLILQRDPFSLIKTDRMSFIYILKHIVVLHSFNKAYICSLENTHAVKVHQHI